MNNDRTHIDKDKIANAELDGLYDGKGYEREKTVPKISTKEKVKTKTFSVDLNISDIFRLTERYINKYLGFIIGNNDNPLPQKVEAITYLILLIGTIILKLIKEIK